MIDSRHDSHPNITYVIWSDIFAKQFLKNTIVQQISPGAPFTNIYLLK